MDITVEQARSDRKVVGLVCGAHFLSHVYMLLLPPLFPQLRDHFGVGYIELGLIVTVFSVTSAITQAPMGFLVDKVGARTLLIAGLAIEGAAFAAMGLMPNLWMVLALAAVAGVCNAVFHPCDYTILNASVNKARMGRAFSAHTFSGYIGFAFAPMLMLFLEPIIGWQGALAVGGGSGVVMAAILLLQGAALQDKQNEAKAKRGDAPKVGIRALMTVPILMAFLFFVLQSLSNTAISTFGVSALTVLERLTNEQALSALTIYLFCSAGGVLIGGWLADRTDRHDLVSGATFIGYGLAVAAIALGLSGPVAVTAILVMAGLCSGVNAPSRDMIVRAAAPAGAMGATFGFVSVGFNVGGLIGPTMYGAMMDFGHPVMVFWISALTSVLCIVTVIQAAAARRAREGVA